MQALLELIFGLGWIVFLLRPTADLANCLFSEERRERNIMHLDATGRVPAQETAMSHFAPGHIEYRNNPRSDVVVGERKRLQSFGGIPGQYKRFIECKATSKIVVQRDCFGTTSNGKGSVEKV